MVAHEQRVCMSRPRNRDVGPVSSCVARGERIMEHLGPIQPSNMWDAMEMDVDELEQLVDDDTYVDDVPTTFLHRSFDAPPSLPEVRAAVAEYDTANAGCDEEGSSGDGDDNDGTEAMLMQTHRVIRCYVAIRSLAQRTRAAPVSGAGLVDTYRCRSSMWEDTTTGAVSMVEIWDDVPCVWLHCFTNAQEAQRLERPPATAEGIRPMGGIGAVTGTELCRLEKLAYGKQDACANDWYSSRGGGGSPALERNIH